MTHTPKPHVLYRFFDSNNVLLYVGITLDPSSRWRDHRQEKPWWTQVTRITLDTHPSRQNVLAAERAAIQAEHPRHNIIHNSGAAGLDNFDLIALSLVGDTRTTGPWGTRASDMPDYCRPCRLAGEHTVTEPFRWADGRAEYVCHHSHYWTCGWGHSHSGSAMENLQTQLPFPRSRGVRTEARSA